MYTAPYDTEVAAILYLSKRVTRPKNYQWCNSVNCTAPWWIAGSVLVQIIKMEEVSKIMKWRKECQKGFLSIISLLSPCLSSLSRKKFLKMSPPFLVLLYLACTRRVLIFAVSLYEMTVFKRNFSTRPWKQGVLFLAMLWYYEARKSLSKWSFL